MDDIVAQFVAVTSCEVPTAQQYLEASDWQLENAVELYFASGGADASGNPPPNPVSAEDDVREAMSGYDDQLIDDEAQMMNDYIRDTRRARARARPRNIFNQARDGDLDESNMSRHEKRLAGLFRPPFDLISDVPLDEAREMAQQQHKLVMVNVQDSGEFACQRLNRDLWRSEHLKDLIYKNFVFLQYDIEDPDGEDYRDLYQFDTFPHIAIIDPWTGEQQKVWSRVPAESEFIEDVVDFVATLPNESEEEEEEEKEEDHKEEEEQKKSPNVPESSASSANNAPSDSEKADEVSNAPSSLSGVAAIPPLDAPEPPMGPEATRIQLRYGDGKRIVRRFLLSDPVSDVYGVAKHVLQFNGSVTLTSERRDLKSELDKTVGEANLKNSTVLVEKD